MEPLGEHLLLECHGTIANASDSELESLMRRAAESGGATVLFAHMHGFGHANPYSKSTAPHAGITGVILLAESHISVHTWPESNYAAFDIFMCGDCQPQKAAAVIAAAYPDSVVEIKAITRGHRRQPCKQTGQIPKARG